MGDTSKRLLRFAMAQADAVQKALAAGDQQGALAAAAVTPWQPKLSADQLTKLFSTDQGQEQVAQKISVITKTPIEQARTQVQQMLSTTPDPTTGVDHTATLDGGAPAKVDSKGRTIKSSGGPSVAKVVIIASAGALLLYYLKKRRRSA